MQNLGSILRFLNLGRRQVVRQRPLEPSSHGSNPCAPAFLLSGLNCGLDCKEVTVVKQSDNGVVFFR